MPTSCSALISIELGASCSVWISWNWVVSDTLILCNKRCQGGRSRRRRRRVERTWGDLESKGSNLYSSAQIIHVRFWVYNQPPVLEICSSDHSCQQHCRRKPAAACCSCSGARNMDPPPPPHQSMPSTHHIYTLSLSFCQGTTTTYSVCGPRVEELWQCFVTKVSNRSFWVCQVFFETAIICK